MPRNSRVIQKAFATLKGTRGFIKKTITSSDITTSAQDLSSVATGELSIDQVIVKTDATGLAGGTNFVVLSNNAKGVVNILVETIANLGANITKVMFGGGINADTTTSDATASVTALPTVLEAGKKLQFNNTGAAGTGAGTIDVYVFFTRLADGANIVAA